MTSSIKPPGGPPKGSTPLEEGRGSQRSGEARESFSEVLNQGRADAAREAGPLSSGEVAAAQSTPPPSVEQILRSALDSSAARLLPPTKRVELEAHLRRVLAEDPTLLDLQKKLSEEGS